MGSRIAYGIAVLAITVCIGGSFSAYAALNYREYLDRGAQAITELYDAEKARQDFDQIIADQDAPPEIKVQAYFWMAYSYLFEGNNEQARLIFSRLFDYEKDPDFDFESILDKTLMDNAELLRMFDVAFEQYHGRSRVIKDPHKKLGKHFVPKKSFFPRMAVLFGAVIMVVVLTAL
jgi:hypothetical protein